MRRFLLLTASLLLVTACESGPKSARGFRLPDGDVEKGKAAFLELKCNACHRVAGLELPGPDTQQVYLRPVVLGGEVIRVRTYGQLVTAIINPSHTLAEGYPKELVQGEGQSLMPDLNGTMTVEQLIHLVAFLQTRYQVVLTQVHPY